MTARDPLLVHSPDSQQPQPSPILCRRRSLSTASQRSLGTRKRSPSPRITFTTAPLSSDSKGVKNITRKVIKTLEGLGHLDSTDMCEQDCETDEKYDEREVIVVLGGGDRQNDASYEHDPRYRRENGITESTAAALSSQQARTSGNRKIDWELPRKALHSSIGFFTIYLYITEGDVGTVVLVLWTALAIIVPADILRLRYPGFERIYERFLGFLMRESEKKSSNGVIWYILGVNFVLSCYPLDVATVAVLILSWADTAASTIGRLFGSRTPPLPARIPLLHLPLAPRKSLAGFLAATFTGACIAVGFWGWIAPLRNGGADVSWQWISAARSATSFLGLIGGNKLEFGAMNGWVGLSAIGIVAGLVSGVAEALDLGALDDNLTLPIISGGCILGFLKLLGMFSPSV